MGLWLVLFVWTWMTNILKRIKLRDLWWLMLLVRKFLGRRLTSKLKDENLKISGFEANIDEHLDKKTDGPLVDSPHFEEDKHSEENKTNGPLVDSPRLEISGKVMNRSIKEDVNLKISGFEANIDEHLDNKTDGPLVGSLRMDMDDKHTEENKTEGPLVDSPHLETLGEVTDRSIKGNLDSKIPGTEANIDEHLDKKTDGEAKSAQKSRTKFCSLL
ncbi:unnamed protein product [Meloidogyne enterolobii]|uniref:Uncharacterized protein n=1 Tax=Meloidogyne enterolobii TaxID=390850 RepID=A0ACB1AZ77_MELEN